MKEDWAFEVLGIDRSTRHALTPLDLRAYYRRALLLYHPDKQPSSGPGRVPAIPATTAANQVDRARLAPETDAEEGGGMAGTQGTIDQVRESYRVLLTLLFPESLHLTGQPATDKASDRHAGSSTGVTGYQIVDLDEFEALDDEGAWRLTCRCTGTYTLTETDLDQGRDVVGCSGCSLLVRVTYQENTED